MSEPRRKLNLTPEARRKIAMQFEEVRRQEEEWQRRKEAEAARQHEWDIEDAIELLTDNGYRVEKLSGTQQAIAALKAMEAQ